MRIDASSGLRGKWFDGAIPIRFVIWGDTDTGEYQALKALPDGSRPIRPNVRYRDRAAQLRFVLDPVLTAVVAAKPKPECPPVPHEVEQKARRVTIDSTAECEYPGCHKRAEWLTGDEQVIEPETAENGRKYERGVIVLGHAYCNRHYRNPITTSLRGVESEILVGARPQ
jgi:hypothetical protein